MVLPARLLHSGSWSDVCILNVSAHGLMIHTGREIEQGTRIEVCRGACTVIGRVMWRDGGRAGLRSDEPIALDEIVTSLSSTACQPISPGDDHRRFNRSTRSRRIALRALEFAGVTVIAIGFAGATLPMMRSVYEHSIALAAPLLGE